VSDLVLVADDDRDIVRFVEVNLKLEGFRVATAHDGDDALAKALSLSPNLVLLDVMMPRMDGYEVCSRLRADGRSAHIPVIMLTAKSLSADKVLGLTAGADDYIIKPFDPMELVARVKSTLRRAREMRALSPLTGLPGSTRIEQEIQQRMDAGEPFAVAYADLDNFKSYNDRYGFIRGDEVISLVAQVLKRVVEDAVATAGFVGHVGGDDFVVVLPADKAEDFAKMSIAGFDVRVPSLYDPEDAAIGSVEVDDRDGQRRRVALVSLSIGVASSLHRRLGTPRDMVAAATELKTVAKRAPGSSWASDRGADG
jgi:PleD family two-component response regulator